MEEIIRKIIDDTKIIDIHTHLFPSEHTHLCLYGIDSLLTYHYLISELFIVYDQISIDDFYKLSKKEQADIIWTQLFILRTPISEACRGVITVCNKLGLQKHIRNRDLNAIRLFFDHMTSNPSKIKTYITDIFKMANVEYTVMTNQIFNHDEITLLSKTSIFSNLFKTSLRIDKLIFDFNGSLEFISQYNYPKTSVGIKNYIKFWYNKLNPEYFMASLPYDFFYNCDDDSEFNESSMNYNQVLKHILIPLAIELNLPIAFKFGTQRGLNPTLGDAGDGLGNASVESLALLCRNNPKCKFLATFLSKVNQHQLCVTARNFPNLHIYGCWWYLNNPSLIEEITNMRIEMLGWGFTFQHSDSRVLEQLLYKWHHSKEILSKILTLKYNKIIEAGWNVDEDEIKRDVSSLLKDSYESFMKKELNF